MQHPSAPARPGPRTGPARLARASLLAGLAFACVFGLTTAQARVVINEILYHAPDDLEDLQFVELHNTTDQPADLGGWSFSKGLRFRFAAGATIQPHGFLVLARNPERFKAFYKVPVGGSFSTAIPTKGTHLELVDAHGATIDSVKFKDRSPWPTGPDGYSGSLERICPEADSNDPSNWISSPLSEDRDKPGGTPGRVNAGFSKTPPPAILSLAFSPKNPAPSQPVVVTASLRAGDAVAQVEVLYQLAGSGYEKPEVSVPMTRQGSGQFSASIPGQPTNQLVRIRVRATGQDGATRFFPAETEPRPALSFYVPAPIAPGTIPFGRIIRTRESEMKEAQSDNGPRGFPFGGPPGGFLGGPPRGDDEERRAPGSIDPALQAQHREQLQRGLDLSPIWFQLTAAAADGSTPDGIDKLKAIFQAKLTERTRVIDSILLNQPPPDSAADLPKTIRSFLDGLARALAPALAPSQAKALATWIEQNAKPTVRGVETIRRRADLEGAWFALTFNADLPPDRLAGLLKAVTGLAAERDQIVAEVLAGKDQDTNFRDQRERADALGERIGTTLTPLLAPEQVNHLNAWSRLPRELVVGFAAPGGPPEPGGFQAFVGPPGPGGPPGFQGPPGFGRPAESRPMSHRSAFIYLDPEGGTPELFDFVDVPSRKGGQKIHFLKDQPLRGMSSINLIYESDMAVLVEPLAYEVYRRAGMAAEQSYHVRLWQDDRPVGYYLLVEQPNRTFLKRAQVEEGGNLYKLLWFGGDVVGQHAKRSNRHTDHADITSLVEALDNSEGPAQWEIIRKQFDVAQVATYFAVNMVLSHWDGFFNNYYTYHDSRGTGKWTMYPWDQDQTWGVTDMGGNGEVFFDMPLTFGMKGAQEPGGQGAPGGFGGFGGFGGGGAFWWRPPGFFSGPLLANPQFRRIYLARIKDILARVYSPEAFEPHIAAMEKRLLPEARIRAQILSQSPEEAERELRERFNRCREHLRKRREFLLASDEIKAAPAWSESLLGFPPKRPASTTGN